MEKVYLIQAISPIDEFIIMGIYSSKELAEAKIKKYTIDQEWLEIKEIEINKETKEFLDYYNRVLP